MTTAQVIVNRGLEICGLKAIGQTPSNSHSTNALEALNDMIASWKDEGLDLQLATLASDDTVYLDASDILCLKQNLGVLLAEIYRLPLSNGTITRAHNLLDSLTGKYLEAGTEEMEYPDNLVITCGRNIITDTC